MTTGRPPGTEDDAFGARREIGKTADGVRWLGRKGLCTAQQNMQRSGAKTVSGRGPAGLAAEVMRA